MVHARIIVIILVVLIVIWLVVHFSRRKNHDDHDVPHDGNHHVSKSSWTTLKVPSKHLTINDAIAYAVQTARPDSHYRIILETQGPHVFDGVRYSSHDIERLNIEAASSTDHMGMYYGHLAGGFSMFGDKGETNLAVSGTGPFNLALSGSNTVITVTGTEIDYPYGFGLGCLETPGWVVGAPPSVVLGKSPNFTTLKTSDSIRWFDATTNLVTDHTITGVTITTISVSPAIPSSPLVRGSGFSVRPRATITFNPMAPFMPELVIDGAVSLIGVQLSPGTPGPIPSQILFDAKTSADIRKCLIHVQVASVAGSETFAYTPNTWMDSTNGIQPANIVMNAAGSFRGFCQNFVGPTAGIAGYGTGVSTCCFGIWINNTRGVYLRANSHCKFDLGEFIRCATGIHLDGANGCQAVWFTNCGTAMLLENGSRYHNVKIIEFAPFPDFPIVIDGQGAGTGLVLRNNSQLYTTHLRLADVPFQAYTDGGGFGIPSGIINTSTTVSNLGTGTVGSLLSSIEFNNSWVSSTEC
uniref:Uncharacterized protein n=1 Tax=viral metagenome TaxID=1070528 RepID=A0A6C0CIC1_9ZZZZ